MANLVNLETVTAHVPGDASRVLLDRVSLGCRAGDRIGVVGLNGGGKTTLLDILTGLRAARRGRVSRLGGLRMAHLAQGDDLPQGARVRDVVLAGYGAEHEWAADPQVRDVLDGLGVHDLDRTVDGLSGGEKRRVALATALLGDLDLVVLDEPTNHLDVEGIGWLAEHLVARRCARRRGHARPVVPRRGVHPHLGGRGRPGRGLPRRLRRLGLRPGRARAAGRRRRGPSAEPRPQGAGLAAARTARAHVQAAVPHRGGRGADRRRAAAARQRGAARLRHQPARRAPCWSWRTPRSAIGGRTLLDRVTWRLGPGDRIGIVGVNGSGKTTLLHALTGERPLDSGRVVPRHAPCSSRS